MESVRITIVAVDRHCVLCIECVCLQPWLSSMQIMCTILYSHLKPDRIYRIFPHYFTNGMILEKYIKLKTCVFTFQYIYIIPTRCTSHRVYLTHCGRVTQICVFNTVKLGTSASSPQCHSTRGNVSRGIAPLSTTRVFGEYFLKISVHKNSQRICYKFLKKHSIKVD